MSKNVRCAAGCGAEPVITRPVPLCVLHGLEVAYEVLPGVLQGSVGLARREAAASRSPGNLEAVAPAPGDVVKESSRPERPTKTEARRLADERLAALRAAGLERVTPRHFLDLAPMVGRSRPWIYMLLGDLVNEGLLVPDYRGEQAGYRFAA